MKAIDNKYQQLKINGLDLGLPKGGEGVCPDQVGHYRHYAQGSIYWHPDTGAREVHGAILTRWQTLGWEQSWVGYPVSDEEPHGAQGRRSRFQHGEIHWSPATGAIDVPAVQWEAYWGEAKAHHESRIAVLRPQGFRMASLAVNRQPGAVTYCAVWAKLPSTDWNEIHGVNEQALGTFLDAEAAAGRYIDLISASGAGTDRVFAATTLAGAPPVAWYSRMSDGGTGTPGSLRAMSLRAQRSGARLTSLSLYEVGDASWAAGVYRLDRDGAPWSVETHAIAPSEDLKRFHVQSAHHGRPEQTAVSAKHWASLYRDDEIGPWASFSGFTRAELEEAVAEHSKQGYFPRHLDVAGGADPRYSVQFKKRLDPLPRRLVMTGPAVPELAGLDERVCQYLQRTGIRAATLSVAKDHRLIYTRAFTWSAQGYAITQPGTTFRIGSMSKVLTAILIRRLMELGTSGLKPESKVDAILDLDAPLGMTKATGFDQITIEQLINHQTKLPGNFAHLDAEVVKAFDKKLPAVSKIEFAAYMMCQELTANSGGYRNTNYLFLGAVVEKLTGKPWFGALKQHVLQPLGLTRPTPTGSTLGRRRPQEVLHHDWDMALADSRMSPADPPPLVRSAYGDVNLEEVGDAIGGMAFASCDLVRVLASFSPTASKHVLTSYSEPDVLFTNTTTAGATRYWHNGGLSNTHAQMARRADGISWVVAYNAGGVQREPEPDYDELIDAAESLPTHDLFGSVGLTSLG